ncbi:MAG: hypothetical protein IPP79_05380 [Chitinophagaceae bacterium]|nr:hypothetical protein [Chitinophagaceae bacterium]
MLDAPEKLLGASILMAIPSLMIFLSIALKASINRWLNIIFGIILYSHNGTCSNHFGRLWWMFYTFPGDIGKCTYFVDCLECGKWQKQFENLKI